MTSNRIPGLDLGNPFDVQLREKVENHIVELSGRVHDDGLEMETLRQEIRKLNRDLLSMKRSLGIMKKEREQIRAILRSLENRLLTITGDHGESANPEKK